MEALAEGLFEWVAKHRVSQDAVFEPINILVQSPGMAQWLKIKTAETLGIAANIHFPLPSSFIWQLYRQHIEGLPEQSAFNKDAMAWKIMSLLPDLLHQAEFAVLKDYLSSKEPLKHYQLSYKIADVFDQYLVYRPDWISLWENDQNDLPDANVSEHPWQPILWRCLVKHTESLNESHFHRANLHTELLQQLSAQPFEQSSAILVFGISAIPQQQLEVLSALSQKTEVVIFWANPSAHYWGDLVDSKTLAKSQLTQTQDAVNALDIGNPLLASWGKLGRDYQDMLLNFDLLQHDAFVAVEPTSMLEHIQDEILNLTYRGADQPLKAEELLGDGVHFPKIELAPQDKSFQVHICHSKVRELEILHDQLLKMFDNNPELQPGDVIVMMPDVANYAPLIDGVFAAVEEKLKIPFAISDRNVSQESAILHVFVQMMKLHQSRLSLSEVMAIFEIPAVMTKFDLTKNEFEIIKLWLQEAGVRWGWDQQDKSYWGLPEEQQNTWQFGLARLLAGYALDGDSLFVSDDKPIAPYYGLEGQNAAALGKFYLFSQSLETVVLGCRVAASLSEKVEFALLTIDQMFAPDDVEQVYLNQLRQALEKISRYQDYYQAEVCQDIFVAQLTQALDQSGVGQRFLAGYVNFCTLMPMRSIPFKVVCLLGMNDGDYPRQSNPIGFDLMKNGIPRKGDRSRRLDDRYLFLEAIQAARQTLYLSYVGYSSKDTNELPPSILLSELIDYCEQCFKVKSSSSSSNAKHTLTESIVYQHALQPFSSQYFEASDSQWFSFQSQWLGIAKQQHLPPQLKPFLAQELVSQSNNQEWLTNGLELDDLLSFFNNPAKALFKQRWQTSLSINVEQMADEEPFGFDPLQRFQLNRRLVEDENDLSVSNISAEGDLPIGSAGELHYEQVLQQSEALIESIHKRCDNHQPRIIEVDIEIAGVRLVGWVDQVYQTDLVLWRAGKIRAKDKMELWLKWLCLCISGVPNDSCCGYYIGTNGEFSLPFISAEQAQSELTNYVQLWISGQHSAVHFYPETSWQWVKTHDVKKTYDTFIGNRFYSGEGQEIHVSRLCPDLSVHFEQFSDVSERLFVTLVEVGEGV